MSAYAQARRTMVDCQLRPFDVTNRALLAAADEVPRERFVPEGCEALAYSDLPIHVGSARGRGRSMLQPMILARMIQALEVGPGMRILDVGGGLGYGSALLARLGASVTALETTEMRNEDGDRGAPDAFGSVVFRTGDLGDGCPEDAPFDAILVNGGLERRPDALLEQLVDGGRLTGIVTDGRGGRATLFVRSSDGVGSRTLFDAAATILPGFEKSAGFVF